MKNYDSEQSRSPAGQPLPYGRGSLALHAFAAATVVATFVLIIVGGIVTTRGAGLAVPDWPLSYGQLMPARWSAMANIAAEHGHRMIAAAVGIMMLALAVHPPGVETARGGAGRAGGGLWGVVVAAVGGAAEQASALKFAVEAVAWVGVVLVALLVSAVITSGVFAKPHSPAKSTSGKSAPMNLRPESPDEDSSAVAPYAAGSTKKERRTPMNRNLTKIDGIT